MEIELLEQSTLGYVGFTVSNALIQVFKKENEELKHSQASLHVQSNREFKMHKFVQFVHIHPLTAQNSSLLFKLLLELWTLTLLKCSLSQKSIRLRYLHVFLNQEGKVAFLCEYSTCKLNCVVLKIR